MADRKTRRLLLAAGAFVSIVTAACGTGPRPSPLPRAATNDAGPSGVADGVSVGYAHSPKGAEAAATGFLVDVAERLVDLSPGERQRAMRRMAMPDGANAITSLLNAPLAAIDQARSEEGNGELLRAVPVAYHLDAYSPGEAMVRVWASSVVVLGAIQAPLESWSTTRLRLEWTGGDWRLAALDATAGPTPASPGAAPSTPADTLRAVDGFGRYRHVPA